MNHYGTEESAPLAYASASSILDAEESSSVGWATPRRGGWSRLSRTAAAAGLMVGCASLGFMADLSLSKAEPETGDSAAFEPEAASLAANAEDDSAGGTDSGDESDYFRREVYMQNDPEVQNLILEMTGHRKWEDLMASHDISGLFPEKIVIEGCATKPLFC